MRTAPKLIGLICGMALSSVPVCRSSADTLLLNGANPAGTVDLYGSALPSGYGSASQAVDAYAGVLDWTDTSNNNASVYTYCIDVASIIYQNNSYSYTWPTGLTPQSTSFSIQQVNAIYNLWNDPSFGNAGNIGGTVSGISAVDAGMFQVALWDILYDNGASATQLTNPGYALYFVPNSPLGSSSLTSSELGTALNAASNDFATASSTQLGSNPGVDALIITTGDYGQNQALYIGGSGSNFSTTPLPASFPTGLALLGICGIAGAWRFRARRLKSEL